MDAVERLTARDHGRVARGALLGVVRRLPSFALRPLGGLAGAAAGRSGRRRAVAEDADRRQQEQGAEPRSVPHRPLHPGDYGRGIAGVKRRPGRRSGSGADRIALRLGRAGNISPPGGTLGG